MMHGCYSRSTLRSIFSLALMTVLAAPSFADAPRTALYPAERARLVRVLTDATTRRDFVGVHAAEALVDVGLPEPARKAFEPQSDATQSAYRIGVWRVMARVETDKVRRAKYVERIRAVLLDEQAADRVHACETLAKLNEPITLDAERAAVDAMAKDPAAGPFALWRLVQAGDALAMDRLTAALKGSDEVGRARAGYVLKWLRGPAQTRPSARDAAAERERLERQLAESDEDLRVAAALGLLKMDEAARSAATTRPLN
jgi:hypothetical protein